MYPGRSRLCRFSLRISPTLSLLSLTQAGSFYAQCRHATKPCISLAPVSPGMEDVSGDVHVIIRDRRKDLINPFSSRQPPRRKRQCLTGTARRAGRAAFRTLTVLKQSLYGTVAPHGQRWYESHTAGAITFDPCWMQRPTTIDCQPAITGRHSQRSFPVQATPPRCRAAQSSEYSI